MYITYTIQSLKVITEKYFAKNICFCQL